MDDVIDDLMRIARRCESAARRFDDKAIKAIHDRAIKAADSVGDAWSGSFMGYQSRVYVAGLRPKRPGEHFDTEWGMEEAFGNRTVGQWMEFDYDTVYQEILRRARLSEAELDQLQDIANDIVRAIDESKSDLLPTLDAVLRQTDDSNLREVRDNIEELEPRISQQAFLRHLTPNQFRSRDARAMQGNIEAPPHLAVKCWVSSQTSAAAQANELAQRAIYAAKYLQKAMKMTGKSVAKKDGPIFIGHGQSGVWKDLREFLTVRLKLQYEEFNRAPTPGLSTKERLLEMLDKCPFAFLVMTGEDEQKDGKLHARANVIHEAGLFQGRYGFERAIILLEDGCEEFSNVNGIGQIRFPKGNIGAVSEEMRRVLEREGLL